jgi:hypothetical protein
LKSGNEMVRFAGAFVEVFDLFVFDDDFGTQESDLAIVFEKSFFQLFDIGLLSRVRPRLFASGRERFVAWTFFVVFGANGRDRSFGFFP